MPRRLRLVFAGTPDFAVPCLRAAIGGGEVVAVYTQPDRPAGRGRKLQPSPVKQLALEQGVEVRQPQSLRDADEKRALAALEADLMIVVAYGLILPASVLAMPRHGCWNIHASLLPRWRGAAPIQRAIEAGDSCTGVCLMQMERGLDTGPVILTRELPIAPGDTADTLHSSLSELGAGLLGEGLTRLEAGDLPPAQTQPEQGVTYAHKLDKREARLDWNESAETLARKVRAFNPWPIAEVELGGERVRIHAATALGGDAGAAPGTLVRGDRDGLEIACGGGRLRLERLQREGGRPMAVGEILNARPEWRTP